MDRMQDTFIEYMIKQKKSTSSILKTVAIVFGAVIAAFLVFMIFLMLPPQLITFMPLAVAAVFYGAYRLAASLNVEFEYTLTNGELDVDKITNRRRRKRLLTIHCKSFTVFARVNDPEHKNEENAEFNKVIDASANSANYDDYYAIFFKNGQKFKLIFNPTAKMIDVFKMYAPRVIK